MANAKLLTAFKKHRKLCNNTINGGDCYGETYCEHDLNEKHKDFMCVNCGCFFCGCCYFYKKYICPRCNIDPKTLIYTCGECHQEEHLDLNLYDKINYTCIKCRKFFCKGCHQYVKTFNKYYMVEFVCLTCQ